MSLCPPVHVELLGSRWRNYHEFWCLSIFQNSVEKIKVSLKSDKNNGYFTWRQIFWSYIAHFFLEREMLQTKIVVKIKTPIPCSIIFFRKLCLFKIIWKNIVESHWLQMAIWRLRFACWMTMATDTHSGYVILIAFPRQQCFAEST
jgi:hypothetical protein